MGLIGVIGGMGPAATIDFMSKVLNMSADSFARTDQQHVPMVVYNVPQVPNRTAAVIGEGELPTQVLIKAAMALKKAGCTDLVMTCNTAHHWFHEVQESVPDLNFVHMGHAVTQEAVEKKAKKVMLFATRGTIVSGFYQRMLQQEGIECVLPSSDVQSRVSEAILQVKAGDVEAGGRTLHQQANLAMQQSGATLLLQCCTEIPLAMDLITNGEVDQSQCIDSTAALARWCVDWWKQKLQDQDIPAPIEP
ncbi:MAG: hypothetical protein MHM6MM_004440 [Cercozoa sp. M6MM]